MTAKGDNPWLQVPVDQYEGHMAHKSVRQAQYLSFVLQEQVDRFKPERLLVPGVSAGNGLEHVDPDVTRIVTGLDIQPDYLEIARERFAERLPGLNLVQQDLLTWEPDDEYDLVFCALLLEYLDPKRAVPKLCSVLAPGGMLVILVQLDGKGSPVSASPFNDVKLLEPAMTLVDPAVVREISNDCKLEQTERRIDLLKSGKSFWIGWFRRPR